MFCRNCGKQVHPQAAACLSCGLAPLNGTGFCQNCGAPTQAESLICTKCAVNLAFKAKEGARSKMAAGLLGVFLGGLGIHRFYLGFTGIGIIQIIVTLVTCGLGSLWGFVEGILVLTGTINRDAQGQPLKE